MKPDLLGIVLVVRPPQNTLLSNRPVVGIELSDVVHVGHHTIDHGVPGLLLLLSYARSCH